VQKYTHTFENEMNDAGFLQNSTDEHRASDARNALRSWYLRHARPLPWREKPSLYGTWLSEIMLQQTRVDTGIPKWHAFQSTFPTVADLAQASEDDVMKAWEGLGYYRRAKLLHRAAKVIHEAGAFPSTHEDWLALPGIGPYTAAAIASIGLGEPVAAVDGNVQRVAARWNAMPLPVDAPQGAKAIQAIADAWLHHDHPGDHNQAVMEVGALVCSPKRPQCDACPLSTTCQSAHNEDLWSQLPVKKPKKKATAWDLTWHVVTHKGSVVAMKRPSEGVWANLWAFPELAPPASFAHAGSLLEPVTHILTHKRITCTFLHWQAPSLDAFQAFAEQNGGQAMTWTQFQTTARPRLLTKVWDDILAALGEEELR